MRWECVSGDMGPSMSGGGGDEPWAPWKSVIDKQSKTSRKTSRKMSLRDQVREPVSIINGKSCRLNSIAYLFFFKKKSSAKWESYTLFLKKPSIC